MHVCSLSCSTTYLQRDMQRDKQTSYLINESPGTLHLHEIWDALRHAGDAFEESNYIVREGELAPQYK